jgi:hypothetical protein
MAVDDGPLPPVQSLCRKTVLQRAGTPDTIHNTVCTSGCCPSVVVVSYAQMGVYRRVNGRCVPLQTNRHQATLLLSRAQENRYKTLRTIICANLSVWDALWRHRIVVRRGGLRGQMPPTTSTSTPPPPRLHLHDHHNLESTCIPDAHIPANRRTKAQRPATRDTGGGAAHDHKHGGACEATREPSCGTSINNYETHLHRADDRSLPHDNPDPTRWTHQRYKES